jgi:hypothetical protein
MASFRRITINGPQFFEEIIVPSFGDLIADRDVRNGYFGEFMVMDDVPHEKKIIDIRRFKNVLKRRDADCSSVYEPLARAGLRIIRVTELGAAVKFCREEFYQGCLKDWRNGDPVFYNRITAFFRNAIATDLISLMYFGDVSRAENSDPDSFNTNKFDGIYTQYGKYVTSGRIPGGQTFNIPNATISASNSAVYLQSLYDRMDPLMKLLPRNELAIYIDRDWADAYENYLVATGQTSSEAVNFVQDGIKVRAFKGIPIFVNPFFNPILTQIVAADAHFGVLTIRGNFVFATDKTYGTGPDGDQALVIWYDWDEDTWKWRTALKAGTQIALPEHSTLAFPS